MLFVSEFRRQIFLFLIAVLAFGWAGTALRLSPALALLIPALIAYWVMTKGLLIHRQKQQLARFMFGTGVLLVAGWSALGIHFVLLTFALPEVDIMLYAIDRRLGFNWNDLHAWIADRPIFDEILRFAYGSFLPQLILVTMLLSAKGREQDLSDFLKVYVVTLFFSVTIGGLLPAHAMCRTSGWHTGSDPEMMTRAACAFLPVYDALRSGQMTQIEIHNLDGLVTFPSFHTTAAILFAWSVRAIPLAALALFPLNALMIAATPTHGGHYLIDIIAGATIALVGIVVLTRNAKHKRTVFSHPRPLGAAY